MEDDLCLNMTFDKRTFHEGQPSKKTTFDGRQRLMKDDLQWKIFFDEMKSPMQDDMQREKTEFLVLRLPKLEFDSKNQVLLNPVLFCLMFNESKSVHLVLMNT